MCLQFWQRGGLWVLGQSTLMCVVIDAGVLHHSQWQGRFAIYCGGTLLLLGAGCGIAGAVELGRNLTPLPKALPSARLVDTGIYRLVRHPLYTAVLCGSMGWALMWRSGPATIAAVALVPLLIAKARCEEAWLRQRFPEYAAYEQRVYRFIPWIC